MVRAFVVCVAAVATLFVMAAPSQALAPAPPPFTTVPTSLAGGATVAEAGVGITAAGLAGAAVAVSAPIILAGSIIYGLHKEWDYFHPDFPDDPGGGGTVFGIPSYLQYDGLTFTFSACDTFYLSGGTCTYPGMGATDLMMHVEKTSTSPENHTIKSLLYGDAGNLIAPKGTYTPYYYGVPTNYGWQTLPPLSSGYSIRIHDDDLGNDVAFFHFTGSAPPSTATVTATLNCDDGSSQTVSVDYTAADAVAQLIAPQCIGSAKPTGMHIYDTLSADPSVPVETWTAPEASPYPDCLPGGSVFPCVVRLQRYSAEHGWQDCATDIDCSEFSTEAVTDPALQLSTQTGTLLGAGTATSNTYRCLWGPHGMPMSDCEPDSIPKTLEVAAPGIGDDSLPFPAGAGASACFPHGWAAFNPAEWVYKPVLCALRKAFIPDPNFVKGQMDVITEAFNASAIGVVVGAVDPIFGAVGHMTDNPSDCEGPEFGPVSFPGTDAVFDIHPLNACADLTQYILGIAMPLLSAFTYIAAFIVGARSIASSVGARDLVPVE